MIFLQYPTFISSLGGASGSANRMIVASLNRMKESILNGELILQEMLRRIDNL